MTQQFAILDLKTDKYHWERWGWTEARNCATFYLTREAAEQRLAIIHSCGGIKSAVIVPVHEAAA